MKSDDIRWLQRFQNFKKALTQLSEFVEQGELSKLEKQGLIKAFEYTYELGWNTIKDYYEFQGETGIQGSRDAIRLALERGLIADGDMWMDMIADRNRTSHTYNQTIADEIAQRILDPFFGLFEALKETLEEIQNSERTI